MTNKGKRDKSNWNDHFYALSTHSFTLTLFTCWQLSKFDNLVHFQTFKILDFWLPSLLRNCLTTSSIGCTLGTDSTMTYNDKLCIARRSLISEWGLIFWLTEKHFSGLFFFSGFSYLSLVSQIWRSGQVSWIMTGTAADIFFFVKFILKWCLMVLSC